jgi:hypothetical protein
VKVRCGRVAERCLGRQEQGGGATADVQRVWQVRRHPDSAKWSAKPRPAQHVVRDAQREGFANEERLLRERLG